MSTGKLNIFFIFIIVFNGQKPVKCEIYNKIEKCCAAGKIISTKNNFSCTLGEIPTELQSVLSKSNWVNSVKCPEQKNISIKKLSQVIDENIETINASSACIDFLHDEKELGMIPIIVYCQKNDTNLTIPKVARFRVCCHRNQFYDIKSRDCIPKQFGEIDTTEYINKKIIKDNLSIEFTSFVRDSPQCKHAIVDYVIDSTKNLKILRNGTIQILLPSDENKSVFLTEENSCLDAATSKLITVRLCSNSEYCQTNACVRKCCPEGQARIGSQCQTIPSSIPPGEFHRELQKFTQIEYNITEKKESLDTNNYGLIVGFQNCDNQRYPVLEDEQPIIDSIGHVHIHQPNHKKYEHYEYCMEVLHNVSGYDDGIYPVVCFETSVPTAESTEWRFGINAALELMSCIFLLITFFVYVFLPVLQNLHGKTLMSHVASLFVAYACLAAVALVKLPDSAYQPLYENIDNSEISAMEDAVCQFIGYTMLFSFLSAFSWLNVMCFDIWWTFGSLSCAARMGGRKQAQRKRFFLYSLYAWGLAFILTCLGVAADYTNIIEENLRPNIGDATCWFSQNSNNYGVLIFFIGPISLQLVVNVIFFILTSLYCSRVKAEITRVMIPASDPKSRRFHSAKAKFILYIKLFIVMGISWIMEIVSTFLNHYGKNLNWRSEFFYVSDTINCLQGLLIFILFVLKSKVYHALKNRISNRNTNKTGNLTTTLNDPHRVQKSASCSTLMSTFPVNNTP